MQLSNTPLKCLESGQMVNTMRSSIPDHRLDTGALPLPLGGVAQKKMNIADNAHITDAVSLGRIMSCHADGGRALELQSEISRVVQTSARSMIQRGTQCTGSCGFSHGRSNSLLQQRKVFRCGLRPTWTFLDTLKVEGRLRRIGPTIVDIAWHSPQ